MATAFEKRVLAALKRDADKLGYSGGLMADVASELSATSGEVHEALIHLKNEGCFRGKPYFDGEQYEVNIG